MKKNVIFKNKNENIAGTLHIPSKSTSSAVIVCHGFLRSKKDKLLADISKEICKKNIFALRFDFRGCGDSDGNSKTYSFYSEVEDIRSAIKFLKNMKIKKFGIVGHSHGGTSVIIASVKNKEILAIVSIAPVASPKDKWSKNEIQEIEEKDYIKYKGNKIGKEMWYSAKNLNLKKILKKLKIPLMIVVGSKDLPAIKDAKTLISLSNKNRKLLIIKGGNHFLTKMNTRREAIKFIANWFSRYLQRS